MNLMDNLKEKKKIRKYNNERQMFIDRTICKLGTIVEEKDRIVCYVSQEIFDKQANKHCYLLNLSGPNRDFRMIEKQSKYFGLDKPVYFIFENIKFSRRISIIVNAISFVNVTFKNCVFNDGIWIDSSGDITFENNKYNGGQISGREYLNIVANKVRFVKEDFNNGKITDSFIDMGISADVLEIYNSKIKSGPYVVSGCIHIEANETNLVNANIYSFNVHLITEQINSINSEMSGFRVIEIENGGHDFTSETCKLEAPCIIYNGKEFNNPKKIDEENELLRKRTLLIRALENIRRECMRANQQRLSVAQDKLNNQAVSRVLKR